ncbi:ferrous iron transport protein A [Agrobacterium sp. S2]|nr:ferrous iron transport protein A [Agrobacterium sp. S2]
MRSTPGAHGCVIRISDHEPEILRYLEAREINLGTRIHLDERNLAVGSVLISHSSVTGERVGDRVEVAIGAADAVWVSVDSYPVDPPGR